MYSIRNGNEQVFLPRNFDPLNIAALVPAWIRRYDKQDIRFDLTAGLTVAVMIIPQGMAYALLAGLPPIYGLYAATVPMVIYALSGSSRQLSVGPVAIDSILTAASVSMIAMAGTHHYITVAILMALMVGLIQFTLGAFRLGFLVNFLSHPIITGFSSAAAIIIGLSQLKPLLGLNLTAGLYLQDLIYSVIEKGWTIHPTTAVIGIASILLLALLKKWLPSLPGPLIVVTIATIVAYIFKLERFGVKIIGEIPQGLPVPSLPLADIRTCKQILPAAFAIALVSFMESNAVARSIQARHKNYRIYPNRELISLGLANMIGSFFKSFPVSGGFSRSMVNDHAGARTGLASVFTAVIVALAVLFMTPLFYYIPLASLAAVILITIYKLINLKEAKYLWKTDRRDLLMMMVTFLSTLFLGISTGIGIGVVLSLAWIIFETSYPHYAELGRIPGTHTFRNIKRFKNLIIEDGVLIFRFDAPLFFANIERFREVLLRRVKSRKTLRYIIIDMESINTVDSTAIKALEELVEELKKENILLLMSEVKGPVRDKFERSGFTEKIKSQYLFMSTEEAVEFAIGRRIDYLSEADAPARS